MNATIGVSLRVTANDLTPALMQTLQSLGSVRSTIIQTGVESANTSNSIKTAAGYFATERAEARWLAIGLSFLGSSITATGVALKSTNTALGNSLGTTLLWTGAIVSAIGTAAQLVKSLGYITVAYKAMSAAQIAAGGVGGLTGIFSMIPGWGWALAGGMLAFGAVTALNRGTAAEKKTEVNIHNAGSVLTSNDLARQVRQSIIRTQQQNGLKSGIT